MRRPRRNHSPAFKARIAMDALRGERYKALKRAGIEDFRWHDLRHTWASWHVQGGTPLFALQELAGWETERMVRRYAHLAAEHLAGWAGNTESHGTNTAQPPDFRGTARLKVVGN